MLANDFFDNLSAELQSPSLFYGPSSGQKEQCHGHKGNGEKCTLLPRKTKIPNGHIRSTILLQEIIAIEDAVEIDEELVRSNIGEFIRLNNCGHHGPALEKRFRDWFKDKGLSNLQDALEPRLNTEGTRVMTPQLILAGSSSEASFVSDDLRKENHGNAAGGKMAVKVMTTHEKPVELLKPDCIVSILPVDQNSEEGEPIPVPSPDSIADVHDDKHTESNVAHKLRMLNMNETETGTQLEDRTSEPTWDRITNPHVTKEMAAHGFGLKGRNHSLRDSSPIYRLMHKTPSGKDMKMGVVYILKKNSFTDVFKIGWTGLTAAQRHSQSTNCYGIDTTIIYESPKPFQFSYRAESLCHTILWRSNTEQTDCPHCQGKHREWFQISEQFVRHTVTMIESLMLLPGYTLQDGKMKLSPQAYALIEGMSRFNMDKLASSLEAANSAASSTNLEESHLLATDEAKAPEDTANAIRDFDKPVPSIETADTENTSSNPHPSPSKSSGSPLPIGSKLGRFTRNSQRLLESRSRSATPDTESHGSGEKRRFNIGGLMKTAVMQTNMAQESIKQFARDFEAGYKREESSELQTQSIRNP